MSRVITLGPTLAVINRSTSVTDAEGARFTTALQVQIDRDFSPIWDQAANLMFVGLTGTIPRGMWQLLLEDHSSDADALGFHLLTDDGYPIGHVYVKDSKADGLSWTVTGSHEAIELLGDPRIDQVRFEPTGDTTGVLRALELCDAVEDDSFGYDVDLKDGLPPVKVSAFQTRQWFQPGPHPPGTHFSFPPGIVSAPFELADGGYIGIWECGKGWSQQLADTAPGARAVKKPTSRTLVRFNRG